MIPKHAIEVLNKVKESIRKHPEEFSMDNWDCGTTACIAGWIGRHAHKNYVGSCEAAEILELPYDTAYGLWFTDHWPPELEKAYVYESCLTMKAEAACRAIDSFIKDPSQFNKRE